MKAFLKLIIDILSAIRRCFIPVGFVIINLLIVWFILSTEQAQDTLEQINTDNRKDYIVLVSLSIWALIIYINSHVALRYSLIYDDCTPEQVVKFCDLMIQKIPVSLVFGMYLLVLSQIPQISFESSIFRNYLVSLILSILLFGFVEYKKLLPKIAPYKEKINQFFSTKWITEILKKGKNTSILYLMIVILGIIQLIYIYLFFWFEVELSSMFSTFEVIIFAASFWLFPSLFLSVLSGRYRISAYTIFVIYIWFISEFNNNHEIRTFEDTDHIINERFTDTTYLRKWVEELIAEENKLGNQNGVIPIYLIAGEGGGIRAAYWTGNLLTKFDSVDDRFNRRILAFSSVSGSTLGVGFYQSLKFQKEKKINDKMQKVCGNDFLTPLAIGFLFRDMIQRMIPLPIPQFDRARFLEDGFSYYYSKNIQKSTLDSSFLTINKLVNYSNPIVIYNSTEVETGRKSVISNVKPTDNYFWDTVDALDSIKADIPLKTAISLSARFPIVTPPALIKRDGKKIVHLVDGGYFENTGLHTIFQILRMMNGTLKPSQKLRIRPTILFLKNGGTELNMNPKTKRVDALKNDYEYAPIYAFINAWDRKSIPIHYELSKIVCEIYKTPSIDTEANIIPYYLNRKQRKLPLGWTLSDKSKEEIQRQVIQMPVVLR